MNGGQLGRALIEQNPWWASDDWARDDPDLRGLANAPFEYRPLPLAGIAPDGLYLLLGPRRVGKSVELKRAVVELIASGVEPRRIVYFSCDALHGTTMGSKGVRAMPGASCSTVTSRVSRGVLDPVR